MVSARSAPGTMTHSRLNRPHVVRIRRSFLNEDLVHYTLKYRHPGNKNHLFVPARQLLVVLKPGCRVCLITCCDSFAGVHHSPSLPWLGSRKPELIFRLRWLYSANISVSTASTALDGAAPNFPSLFTRRASATVPI